MYRIVNGLYGFIIGDALGVPVEFNYRFVLEQNPVKDMREYGSHGQPKGTWSDDTSMMLATIDSIIDNKGYNSKSSFYDMANKFVLWYKESKYTPNNEVFDMGRATRTALNNYIYRKDKLCGCGEISDNGNGSLMRILPLAYYFWVSNIDIVERKNIVFDVSSITHSHIISKYGCMIYVEFVLNILKNQNNSDLLKIYMDTIKQINELLKTEEKENRKIIEKAYRNVLNGKIYKEKYENIKSSGYVVDTLEAVLWTIFNTNNFDDAVLKEVNLGDDTDTIGALTGGIAGTFYDTTKEKWIENLQAKEYLQDIIRLFVETLEIIKRRNHKFDLGLLEETINDLKNNPDACKKRELDSEPGKQLSKFMEYMYDENLTDKEYLKNDKKIKNKDISQMNFDETITEITLFLRGERFCGGFWYSNFKDGTILKLLERLKEILENKTNKSTDNVRYLDRDYREISEIGNLYIEAVLNLTGGFQNISQEEKNKIFNFANIISEEYKKMIEHEDRMMAKEKIWIKLRNKYPEYFDFMRFVMSNNSILNIDDKIKKINRIFGLINNIEIVYGDITDMTVDVIVNAANKTLLGGGGVDGAIHQKAGVELYNVCKGLGGCNTGDAKITDGYKLKAKKIIHTVAPIWNNENIEENKKLLRQCYETSYKLAKETKLETIAFPCLGMGVYQIPLEVGAFISLESAICNCMNFEKIYLVCYGKKEFDYYCTLLKEMKQL